MSNSAVPQVRASETPRALAVDSAVVLVPLGLFVAVVAVAAPNGSYFPSSWGWASLAFLWAAAIGILGASRVVPCDLPLITSTCERGSWFEGEEREV